jgi:hypothetical protein
MKALVYNDPGEHGWDSLNDPPIIDLTDALDRIDTATSFGGSLHTRNGDGPETLLAEITGPRRRHARTSGRA